MLEHLPTKAIPHEVFKLLGFNPRDLRCTAIEGKGEANEVYLLERELERFIVRLHAGEENISTYRKERWCIEQTAKLGVPNAECVGLGVGSGKAFMVQTALTHAIPLKSGGVVVKIRRFTRV
jgi:hypothetical protein